MGIRHGLDALPPLQIRMHHLPDDGAWPDDRDFDDDVVEPLRAKPRKRRHLRPRLDLEDPDGVGLLQHLVDGGIVGGEMGEVEPIRVGDPGSGIAGSGSSASTCLISARPDSDSRFAIPDP